MSSPASASFRSLSLSSGLVPMAAAQISCFECGSLEASG